MIEKVVRKANLQEFSEIKENLAYWLSKSPEERVEAVEFLRRMLYGSLPRIQKCVRIVRLGEYLPTRSRVLEGSR
jgi:hypothetical protein